MSELVLDIERPDVIYPDWNVPDSVKAISTTRLFGVSKAPFASNNLALHVADREFDVGQNRQALINNHHLPSVPVWLNQTHSTFVINAVNDSSRHADASFSTNAGVVCVVMTADCLPVLLTDSSGSRVAAIHAGWRGLSAGIIEKTVDSLSQNQTSSELIAWLGPAIGPAYFEVGDDVYQAFTAEDNDSKNAFKATNEDRWLADIYLLARLRLLRCGVQHISGGDFCTYRDETRFYSYRRSGTCGRMASMIWLDK